MGCGSRTFLVSKEGRTSFRRSDGFAAGLAAIFSLQAITVGEDDSLWLGTKYGLIRRLPDGRLMQYTLSQNPQSDYIRSILADKRGNIWATHPAGLYVLKPEPISTLGTWNGIKPRRLTAHRPVEGTEMPNHPGEAVDLTALAVFGGEGNQIREIFQQSNGQIWLTAHNRLVLFNGSRFLYFSDARRPFVHLIEDRDGDLWISTLRVFEVMRFSLHGLVTYDRSDGLKDPEIDSIQEDGRGVLHTVSPGWFVSEL